MSFIENRKGPLTHIRQVIKVINSLILDINTCLAVILTGTPNTLSGYDDDGNACDVALGIGVDLTDCELTSNEFNKICVVVAVTPYTVTTEDILLVDVATVGSDVEIILPPSSDRFDGGVVHPVTIKHLGGTNDVIDLTPDGIEEVEGVVGVTKLKKGVSLEIKPDNVNWWII